MTTAQLAKTLIPAGLILGIALFPGGVVGFLGSFAVVGAAMVFLPWAIYSLVRIAIRPAERRSRAIRIAVWTVTLAIAVNVRAHWDSVARKEANGVASAVQAHKGRTGAYPKGLNEVGMDAQALREKYSLSYRVGESKAYLFYSQPSMPTVAHHYTFETNSWESLH